MVRPLLHNGRLEDELSKLVILILKWLMKELARPNMIFHLRLAMMFVVDVLVGAY